MRERASHSRCRRAAAGTTFAQKTFPRANAKDRPNPRQSRADTNLQHRRNTQIHLRNPCQSASVISAFSCFETRAITSRTPVENRRGDPVGSPLPIVTFLGSTCCVSQVATCQRLGLRRSLTASQVIIKSSGRRYRVCSANRLALWQPGPLAREAAAHQYRTQAYIL